MTARTNVRRVPSQARSKRRYEAILDAAAIELGTVGFEAATMEAIAERASTSIGSVYAFFPNKLALFEAIAARCRARSEQKFDAALDGEGDSGWDTLVDRAVDGFAAFHSDPSFRAVWMNMQLYGVVAKDDAALHRAFTDRTERIVARHAPHLPPRKRCLIATMLVQGISALLYVAARARPDLGAAMIAETKVMMRRYVAPYAAKPARTRPIA